MDIQQKLDVLAGLRVSAKTIVGNTIQIWLGFPPQDEAAVCFSLEAPWRIVGPEAVIATSAEMPWEQGDETEVEYRARTR